MNACKSCKQWDKGIECDDAIGFCESPHFIHTNRANIHGHPKNSLILIASISKDATFLITGPDFGCIHWEGK